MEVREHIEQLTEEGKIPKWFAKAKLEDMESRYRSSFEELKKTYSSRATYVALEDVLEIERIQKEGDLRSLEFRDAENRLVKECCVPNWPVPLPLVHHVGAFYGMKPVGLPRFNCTGVDSRLSWFLCAMVCFYLIFGWLWIGMSTQKKNGMDGCLRLQERNVFLLLVKRPAKTILSKRKSWGLHLW
jgi:hypothetical protein